MNGTTRLMVRPLDTRGLVCGPPVLWTACDPRSQALIGAALATGDTYGHVRGESRWSWSMDRDAVQDWSPEGWDELEVCGRGFQDALSWKSTRS